MAEGLMFIAALIGFEVVAARFATSTRDGEDWIAHDQGPHLMVNA